MAPIPEGYCQANFQFGGTQYPTGAEVTHAFRLDNPADTPADVALALYTLFNGQIMANLTTTTTLVGVLVKFGPDDTGPSAVQSGSAAGSVVDAGIQPGTCYLVNKNTNLGGRVGKGRMYMPGLAESAVGVGGEIASGNVSAFQSDWNAFLAGLGAADLTPVLLHGGNYSLLFPSVVTSYTVQSRAATQRRRLRR